MTQARYGIAFGAIGAAQAVFDEACRYSQIRVQFDKPIARFQLVQNKLVWMAAEITKAQLMCWKLGKMKDDGTMQHFHVSMAKRHSCWMALECCRLARDILQCLHDELIPVENADARAAVQGMIGQV